MSSEGLFCLFCGRTAGEHLGDGDRTAALAARDHVSIGDGGGAGMVEEEDDWDAIQEELKRLTRRCQHESEAREKAELLLTEMKSAFEKLREDVGQIRTWGANTDGQLGHYGGKPSLVEIRGVLRQLSCGGAHSALLAASNHLSARGCLIRMFCDSRIAAAALTDDGQLYVWGRGNEGQLGLGDYRPRTVCAFVARCWAHVALFLNVPACLSAQVPALVKALGERSAGTSVLQVACGAAHSICLYVRAAPSSQRWSTTLRRRVRLCRCIGCADATTGMCSHGGRTRRCSWVWARRLGARCAPRCPRMCCVANAVLLTHEGGARELVGRLTDPSLWPSCRTRACYALPRGRTTRWH